MKQTIAALLALMMMIGLSACSQVANPEPSVPTPSAVSTTAQPTAEPSPEPTVEPSPQPTPEPTSETAAVTQGSVSVVDLYNEFEADSGAATSKYSGESVVSTGIVVRTGPDIHGTPSIELSDTEGGKVYVLYVVNSFDQLDEVSVGETVTMKGNFHVFSTGEWGVVMKQGEVIQKGEI